MGINADILPSPDAGELIDFTCVSPWERLALDIELEFRAWGICDGKQLDNGVADHVPVSTSASAVSAAPSITPDPFKCSTVHLGDVPLSLEFRSSTSNKWLHSFPLERLFGTCQYVLLTSASSNGMAADDTSDASILLSALCVAATACECPLPLFVPLGRPSSLRFIGRQVFPVHRRFSCDYTNSPSNGYTHLAGLLSLFHNKRVSAKRHASLSVQDALVEAHFSYDWTDFSFKLSPTPGTFASDRRLAAQQLRPLSTADPIRRIRISAVWDPFPAADLQQNQILAAMPAATAMRLRISPSSQLTSYIANASFPAAQIPMTTSSRAMLRLAQIACTLENSSSPAAPVALLNVHNIIALCRDIDNTEQSQTVPLLEEYLAHVGDYLSAEAIHVDGVDEEFLTSAIAAIFETDPNRGVMFEVVDALGPNPAETSLLERVARLMAVSETPKAAARLWNLFIDGVQVHWESQTKLSGVEFDLNAGPNHAVSLVLQKFQMINCCIERLQRQAAISNKLNKESGSSSEGEGRKHMLDGVDLMGPEDGDDGQKRRVWAPEVQPHLLFTRDMVEEELQRMVMRAESGEKGDGVDLEAKRQSLTLKSDMMAFKAANPGAGLADFVRWFSPSDWVGENDECMGTIVNADKIGAGLGEESTRRPLRGRLSARMSRRGNIWEELWKSAEPIPAHRQVPLFDAAGHGTKALGDLRAMSLTEVLVHLVLIQCGKACEVLESAFSRPPKLPRVSKVIENATQAVRHTSSKSELGVVNAAELGNTAAMVEQVATAEHTALVATSVLTKLPPADGMSDIADALAVGDFMDVVAEKERLLLIRMAGLDDGGWRNVLLPEVREFVLTSHCGDRMYARLNSTEFRVGFQLSLDYQAQ